MSTEEEKKVMKALLYNEYGQLDKLQLSNDFPIPAVGDDEILVETHAAALNPIDWKLLFGYLKDFFPKKFPVVVGYDAAGVVKKVGKNVTKFKVGDEVMADTNNTPTGGTFAEYFLTKEVNLALKPKNLSFEEASVLPVISFTADVCLQTVHAQKGSKVLVLGGSSGVGSSAIQIAKHLGVHIITTCSSANVDSVKQLGADQVVDYKKENWSEVLKGQNIDGVIDAVGEKDGFELAKGVVKKGAVFVTVAGAPAQSTADFTWQFVATAQMPPGPSMQRVGDLVAAGHFKPILEKTYDFKLESILEMFQYSASNRAKGKLVVKLK